MPLVGGILQHQGSLSGKRGNLPRSAKLFEQAIHLFQRAGNQEGEMQTFDLLAGTEERRGHLDAAEAWYAKSRELAEARSDQVQLATTAHNLGVLYQKSCGAG